MQQATQVQSSPSGQSSYQPKPTPNLQDKTGTWCPQPQREPPASKETPLKQLDKDKKGPRHIPRLRAVVESQAFKNILVDEMDMMLSRAATLIQANWRGYQLRRKLISQMLVAKTIQENWRRFNTRRLLRSGKAVEKKVSVEERDIPYRQPQQVRFQHSEEGRCFRDPPVMVSKETQFPSADNLGACVPQLALLQPPGIPQPGMQIPCCTGSSSITFLPHQTVSVTLPCPESLDTKCQPCLLTRTIRSSSLVHVEDIMKIKQVTAKDKKEGALWPPSCEKYVQTLYDPLKAQIQAHVKAEVLKASSQIIQASAVTKAPLQPCPGPTIMMTKTPSQKYPAAAVTKTPLQSCLASIMSKTLYRPCPAPTVTTAKTLPPVDPAAPVSKAPIQSCMAKILNKIQSQPCPVPTKSIMTPTQPCLADPVTKTPTQMQPTASMTNTAPQTQPAAMNSIIKSPPQTCPVPMMTRTPPQKSAMPVMAKMPPQTCPVPVTAKTPTQVHPTAKTPLQTGLVAKMAKTPSQTLPGTSVTKTPPQTRLAAMITKTPPPLYSVPTIFKTLCLLPLGNLKSSAPAVPAAGIPNTSPHTYLNKQKAKAGVTERQTAGTAKVSSGSHLIEGKVKHCSIPPLGVGAPKAPARPFLEAEKIKAFSQKQVKTATVSNTSVAADGSKVLSQAHLKTDVTKVQSQVCVPVERAVALRPQSTCQAKSLPQGQMATSPTTASPQGHLLTKLSAALPQAILGSCLPKPPPQEHPPAKLTKTQSQAHLTTGEVKVQSRAHLPTGLIKAQSQAQLVTETAKCLCAAHQASELSSETQSHPLLAGFKASTQPCQHVGSLGTLSRVKPADRLTQLPAHSYAQCKTNQDPQQGASEIQSMPVPLLPSTGNPTCRVELWGDSEDTRAQSSTTSSTAPCQEELAASQLASLCAEPAAVLGSREDLGTLLTKARSHGEVRAALNQALSKEVFGTTVAKTLPQGTLDTALAKALSWGELDTALSHTLSQGELETELTKAVQGKLADMLSKALMEEERAALSQVLCQGELGTVLSQILSQVALRTGLVLPKATSKTLESGMTVTLASPEVDYKRSPSAALGPVLGRVRPQPSKVDHHHSSISPDRRFGPVSVIGDGASYDASLHPGASGLASDIDPGGPVDAGVAGGQVWNSTISSVAVRPARSSEAPCGARQPARCAVPWDAAVGREAAMDPRQLGELEASVQVVEKIVVQAVVTIQACARGYLVRRTIKVWHQWAVIIQAAWRGHCVRRDLAQLCRAAATIQAAWRGYHSRRHRAQQMLSPGARAEVAGRARSTSDHHCFQSCRPHVCAFCQSLSSGLGSPPSAVMLVGCSPRTCHMCGHSLPTRVVQGMGQGIRGQAGRKTPQRPQQLRGRDKAATVIQSAWRGCAVRRHLRQQQVAARMLQATWRGHCTRASVTTDGLLGPAAWDSLQSSQWPGV